MDTLLSMTEIGKIVEALNEDQGIVDTRKVDSDTILTIRRFTSNE